VPIILMLAQPRRNVVDRAINLEHDEVGLALGQHAQRLGAVGRFQETLDADAHQHTSPAPTVPIILMLAQPRRNVVDRAINLGVNEIIAKPFSLALGQHAQRLGAVGRFQETLDADAHQHVAHDAAFNLWQDSRRSPR
jgi:DNA-binding NarL/FixJ family response regulator